MLRRRWWTVARKAAKLARVDMELVWGLKRVYKREV